MSGREVLHWRGGSRQVGTGEGITNKNQSHQFPRAAHMGQVKRGFGSWQRCPEQGMDLGRLLLRLCKGPGREGKSWKRFRVHWFSKGDAATFQ